MVGTPQQNGVAEWMNKTIIGKVRCMFFKAKLSNSFWAKEVATACFLTNRPPLVAIYSKTPIEVWSYTPAVYFGLKNFYCPAYAC